MRVAARDIPPQGLNALRRQVSGHYVITEHLQERMAQKQISMTSVLRTITTGAVVEFHTEQGTRRVQLCFAGICVVVDLDKRVVVTAFRE